MIYPDTYNLDIFLVGGGSGGAGYGATKWKYSGGNGGSGIIIIRNHQS